jgi:protein gp37
MLNKQGKGKIDWTDYTWNPITGCLHDCDYCYVKRLAKRFGYSTEPQLHPHRLKDIATLKHPAKIFVCSTGDMWGDWVKREWIDQVLDVVRQYPQHTFQFLTKNPERYLEFDLPYGWYGASIDGTPNTVKSYEAYGDPYADIPGGVAPLYILKNKYPDFVTFYSFEPLLSMTSIPRFDWPVDWIIIGADSNKGANKIPLYWVDTLITIARANNIDVFIKDNVGMLRSLKYFPKRYMSKLSRREIKKGTP